jgi:hypothetical protein
MILARRCPPSGRGEKTCRCARADTRGAVARIRASRSVGAAEIRRPHGMCADVVVGAQKSASTHAAPGNRQNFRDILRDPPDLASGPTKERISAQIPRADHRSGRSRRRATAQRLLNGCPRRSCPLGRHDRPGCCRLGSFRDAGPRCPSGPASGLAGRGWGRPATRPPRARRPSGRASGRRTSTGRHRRRPQ